jgi:hypothetical protein
MGSQKRTILCHWGWVVTGADACRACAFSGNSLAPDELQESESLPSKTEEANGDPHAQDHEKKTSGACWSHAEHERTTQTRQMTTMTREGRRPQQKGPC